MNRLHADNPSGRTVNPSCASTRLYTVLALVLTGLAGCASYQPPEVGELPFRAHEVTREDERLRVTAAVLTNDEAQDVFGVDLRNRWIQAVWLEITNKDDIPYWLLFPSLDPDYYSADEVAYAYRSRLSGGGYRNLARYLRENAFHNPVRPGETRSGYVFVTMDQGAKEIDVQLLSLDRVEEFVFYLKVPGLRSKSIDEVVDGYPEEQVQQVGEDELRYALTYLPCCTTDVNGEGEGDPLNLIFIGNPDDLIPAFIRRGWRPAEETYWNSVWKTIGSFVFGSRYAYSPVSPLYVFGRSQDIALQKARESVNRRNHLRLWLTPLRYRGKAIWVGQISRDIGVRFTTRSGTGVTHKIDPNVDETRNAIAQDMLFSQGLSRLGFVRGVGESAPENPNRNLTGDPYFTDGLRAVLLMDREPTLMRDVEFFRWDHPGELEIQEGG